MQKLQELSKEIRKRIERDNLDLSLVDVVRENPIEFIRDCPLQNTCDYKGLRRECYFHGTYNLCPMWNEYQNKLGIGGFK
ncbi:MAG: hypothetical protein ACOCUD_01755 [Bacillota bacterium]